MRHARASRRRAHHHIVIALAAALTLLGSPALRAEDGKRAAPAPQPAAGDAAKRKAEGKAAVLAAWNRMEKAKKKYDDLVKKVGADATKRTLLEIMNEAFQIQARRFIDAFRASGWEEWAEGDTDEAIVEGLYLAGQIEMDSDAPKARRAFDLVIRAAPDTQRAIDAAVWDAMAAAEDPDTAAAIAAVRGRAAGLAGANKARAELVLGELLLAAGETADAAAVLQGIADAAGSLAQDAPDRPRAERIAADARLRLALVGKPLPALAPGAWCGRPDGPLAVAEGRAAVVFVGHPECRGCLASLERFGRNARARAAQPVDTTALLFYSPRAFLPNATGNIELGQEVYDLDPPAFVDHLSRLRGRLGVEFPIGVASEPEAHVLGLTPPRHGLLLVVGDDGKIVFVGDAERSFGLVSRYLDHQYGKVELPPRPEGGAAAEPVQVDPALHVLPQDAAPLPEGPHFAAEFLEIEAAYQTAPDDAVAALAYSRALARFGRHLHAADVLEAAITKSPRNVELMVQRASEILAAAIRLSRNPWQPGLARLRMEETGTWIERALAVDPESIPALALKSAWIGSNPEAEAGAGHRLAVKLAAAHPDEFRAQAALGDAWFRMASTDVRDKEAWGEVEAAYTAARKLNDKDSVTWLRIGLAKMWQGSAGALAAPSLEKAVTLDPSNTEALRALMSRNVLPTPRDRRIIAERLLRAHPTHLAILRAAALAMNEGGSSHEDVIAFLQKAVDSAPTEPGPHFVLGWYLRLTNRDGERGMDEMALAARLCRGVLDRSIYDEIDTLATRNRSLKAEERDRLWSVLFHEFPKEINAPGNAEVWFRDQQNNVLTSYVWCLRALQADPDDASTYNDIGILHESNGPLYDLAKAEQAYVAAVEAAQRKGQAHPQKNLGYKNAVDNLAKLLLRAGRNDDLVKFAEAHLRDDPRFEDLLTVARE